MDLIKYFPQYALVLRSLDLRLRWVRPEELGALADAAAAGIVPEGSVSFSDAWNKKAPGRQVVAHGMRSLGSWDIDKWSFPFGVFSGGKIVGVQSLSAEKFADRRVVGTGSWLSLDYHGQGIGTLMRQMVLAFAFDYLGAEVATSSALEGNTASMRISEKLGYQENGRQRIEAEDRMRWEYLYLMEIGDWKKQERPVVKVEGFDACRSYFGVE